MFENEGMDNEALNEEAEELVEDLHLDDGVEDESTCDEDVANAECDSSDDACDDSCDNNNCDDTDEKEESGLALSLFKCGKWKKMQTVSLLDFSSLQGVLSTFFFVGFFVLLFNNLKNRK